MASSTATNIGKFESLNSFIHERLTTTAGEIFQVVKDTLAEFQEEIYRSKQENIYLKRRLAEVSSGESDAQTKQEELPLEKQNSNPGPLDLEKPVIHMKLELSTVHQDPETQQQLCAPSASSFVHAATTYSSPRSVSDKVGEDKDVDVCMDSYVTVKVEQSDSQVTCSDPGSAVQKGIGGTLGVHKDEPGMRPSSQPSDDRCHPPSRVESSLAGVLFPCEVCSKSFKNNVLLKKHMLTHQKETAHRCEFCGKCYGHSHALQNHIRTHAGEKPYHCKFCNKTFGRKGHMQDHEKIHTGEKPYSCARCGKRFIWLNQVKLHIQNYHPEETGIIIKKSTKHGILKIAHQSENKYPCEVCGKNYSSQHVLRNHLRVHTGERPFKCKFCAKTFTQRSHMLEHERIHTGEQKYSCSECGLSFIWLRQAKAHVQNHHDQCAKIVRK
ncbi:zinc finger protein 250-like [Colossoma macropomum]|uniref:zinc finger protein 250-like n=1 Tax=Colossoma macropomum TaxID=42526 RepID=UPI0018654814|nr:zinc finger protein 250-like [Colossoma macropomum]